MKVFLRKSKKTLKQASAGESAHGIRRETGPFGGTRTMNKIGTFLTVAALALMAGACTSMAAVTKSLPSFAQYTHRRDASAQSSAQYEQRSVCASMRNSMNTGHDPQKGQYPRFHA